MPTERSSPRAIITGATILGGPALEPLRDHAIVINGDRIERVVARAEAERMIAGGAARIRADGATVLPGLIDAHAHLDGLGAALETVDLTGTQSEDEVVARVARRAAQVSPGDWITGRGWDQNDWDRKEFPTAAALDRLVPDRPVWMTRIDGHAALANSAAMKAAGITASTREPEGGRIVRDSSGNPTGVFIDNAKALVANAIPQPSRETRKRRILAAARNIAANGLTEIHDAGADQEVIDLVKELIVEKKLPIRLYLMLGDDESLLNRWLRDGPLVDYAGRLTVRSIKLYADGALGSRGAALLEPYGDDPGNRGLAVSKPEHIEDIARRAIDRGFQVVTHAIGDRGVRNVLEAYERAGVAASHRSRIEHLQVIALEDLPRLAKSGIVASMQPTHATSDMPWAEARVGPERIRGAYAWRRVLDAGARIALGSDFPVEAVNPMFGLYAAVTRQDQSGEPAGGWMPGERLTITEAIRGFTADAAWAAFEETSRGTIEPGKLADLTIVDSNPLETPPAELFRIPVRMTIVGGEVVYEASSKSSK